MRPLGIAVPAPSRPHAPGGARSERSIAPSRPLGRYFLVLKRPDPYAPCHLYLDRIDHLVVRVRADDRRNDGARARAGDHARQRPVREQCLRQGQFSPPSVAEERHEISITLSPGTRRDTPSREQREQRLWMRQTTARFVGMRR